MNKGSPILLCCHLTSHNFSVALFLLSSRYRLLRYCRVELLLFSDYIQFREKAYFLSPHDLTQAPDSTISLFESPLTEKPHSFKQ